MDRREFLKTAGLGLLGLAVLPLVDKLPKSEFVAVEKWEEEESEWIPQEPIFCRDAVALVEQRPFRPELHGETISYIILDEWQCGSFTMFDSIEIPKYEPLTVEDLVGN